MTSEFAEKVFLVTGATSGIGKATALRFAREGARLALLDLDPARLADTVQRTGGQGFAVDVSSEPSVDSAVARPECDGVARLREERGRERGEYDETEQAGSHK